MSAVQGVVTGLVTAVDEQNAPGKPVGEGRIKVSFRWLGQEHETDWIRIATPMAGNDRGVMFMPKVDDEVLLGFEHGDVHHPYAIGFLWNGVDEPPSDHVRKRMIKSEHHRITFLDATPSGGSRGALVIQDGHGNVISLSNGKILIQAAGVLELEAPIIALQGRRPPGGDPPWRRVIAPNNNSI